MKNTFNVRVVGVSLTVAALLGCLAGCRAFRANSDSEDRSRIIVRSGSVEFKQKVNWKYEDNTKKKAYPDQPNGASVTGFQVVFKETDLDAACPRVPIVGDSVEFEYVPSTGAPQSVTLSGKLDGGNTAPLVSAPEDMAIDNRDSNDKKLTYGSSGSIVSVTVKYGGSATQKCTSTDGKFDKDIEIKPLR